MNSFIYTIPTKIYFGKGQLERKRGLLPVSEVSGNLS